MLVLDADQNYETRIVENFSFTSSSQEHKVGKHYELNKIYAWWLITQWIVSMWEKLIPLVAGGVEK